MPTKDNAAQVAVKAAALLKTTQKELYMPATQAQDRRPEAWVACLLIEGAALPDGMTTNRTERLPGAYQTPAAAMAAAMGAIEFRPDAIGATARRVQGGAEYGL